MGSARSSVAGRPPRVLVGLGETAGYCALLAEGLRRAGADATHLNLGADPMRYASGPGSVVRAVRWLGARRRSGPGPGGAWATVHRLAMAWLFLDALRRYDVFILRAGDSFFALRDLPLLRRLGKTVIVVFFGSDSRPSYLNGAEIASGRDAASLAATTGAKRRMVELIERHVTHVVVHPMSAHLHRRRAVAFLAMGIPRRVGAEPTPPRRSADGSVRLLHAPSRPHDKGTDRVRAAIDALRAEGLPVELRVVSGRPNAEVLAAIRESDVVIDQLFSDTPMAALAAEAAALGRPAIVGGYGWETLRRFIRDEDLPPTHRCHPDHLADAIRRLVTDQAYRLELGRRARAFLEERWASERVAERYLALARGEAAAGWLFDPAALDDVHGAGAPEATVRDAVRGVLEVTGPDGLHLADKPHLVERLLALVSRTSTGGSG